MNAIDLFAGAGGLSLGLEAGGFEIEVAVELNGEASLTYESLHPGVELQVGNIKSMSFRHLRGDVALVAGGPPCQPFSSGGKRLGASDPRDCFPELLRVVDEVQPPAVLVENVAGLAGASGRAYLDEVIASLEELGFLVSWTVLDAADHGVPQHRRRLFVMGLRDSRFLFPNPLFGPTCAQPWRPAGDFVKAEAPLGESNPSIVTYARRPDLRPSPYDGHLFNGGGRPLDLAKPSRTILASAGGNKTHFVDTLGLVPGYHADLATGGSPRAGRVPGARRLTVSESAALQTFPASAQFAGSRSRQYEQIGNAVPPLLAATLSDALVRQLERPLAAVA